MTYSYDEAGNLTGSVLGDGTTQVTQSRAYDAVGQLESLAYESTTAVLEWVCRTDG